MGRVRQVGGCQGAGRWQGRVKVWVSAPYMRRKALCVVKLLSGVPCSGSLLKVPVDLRELCTVYCRSQKEGKRGGQGNPSLSFPPPPLLPSLLPGHCAPQGHVGVL